MSEAQPPSSTQNASLAPITTRAARLIITDSIPVDNAFSNTVLEMSSPVSNEKDIRPSTPSYDGGNSTPQVTIAQTPVSRFRVPLHMQQMPSTIKPRLQVQSPPPPPPPPQQQQAINISSPEERLPAPEYMGFGESGGGGDRVTYKKVSSILSEIYNNEQTVSSTALDILSVYLKGQKILYIEAKTHCEQSLNSLMLPAIVISTVASVLSVYLKPYDSGGIVVASMTALNSCILSLISYLKLDAKAEAHKTAAYKFDKLQSLCEFQSGKVLFFDSQAQAVSDLLSEIEGQVKEIKETDQFVLPELIRHRYPVLYSTNVFSIVKKLQNEEIILTNRLKSAINEVAAYYTHIQSIVVTPDEDEAVSARMSELEAAQNESLETLIEFRNQYLDIDEKFKEEIDTQSKRQHHRWNVWNWCKN